MSENSPGPAPPPLFASPEGHFAAGSLFFCFWLRQLRGSQCSRLMREETDRKGAKQKKKERQKEKQQKKVDRRLIFGFEVFICCRGSRLSVHSVSHMTVCIKASVLRCSVFFFVCLCKLEAIKSIKYQDVAQAPSTTD